MGKGRAVAGGAADLTPLASHARGVAAITPPAVSPVSGRPAVGRR